MTSIDPPPLSLSEIGVLVSILVAMLAGLVWLIRAVGKVRHETSPNSGKSMKDQIGFIRQDLAQQRVEQREEMHRIEAQISTLHAEVQKVHGRVTQHMEWHLDHAEGRAHTRASD